MNRLENERYHSALFNLGTIAAFWVKLLAAPPPPQPPEPPTATTPTCPSHTQIYTPPTHTHTLTHLTPSHPIILWQSPLCPCGPPTQRDPAKAN